MKKNTFARRTVLLALASAAVLSHLPAWAQSTQPLRIGASTTTAQSLEVAAAEARKQGLEVKIIEFSDWTTPNTALSAKDLDANYFQHQPFLDNANRQAGSTLRSIDVGVLPNIGIFSSKVKKLSDVKEGARVSVYNDTSNQARGLLLLEKVGLITLKKVPFPGLDDITANPRKLRFTEIPGPQLARAFEDVDLAVGAPLFFVNAGRNDIANGALAYSGVEGQDYALRFVTRADNTQDARVLRFIRIFQESPVVRQQIHVSYANNDKLYSLPWQQK